MSKHAAVTRAEAGGQTWRTWLPSARQQGPVEGDDKRPVSTAYKSVTMGMWIRRVGDDFTLHLLTSCWESGGGGGAGVGVTAMGHARMERLMDKLGSDG